MHLALPKGTSFSRRYKSPNRTSEAAEVYCNLVLFGSADGK